jgi:cytidine deaminase
MAAIDWEVLKLAAIDARGRAYAPYSDFAVGAALLTHDGRVFQGCNVENASYGATICAERGALAAAVVAGERGLVALAIATGAARPTPPCGICRQCLSELVSDLRIRSFTKDGAFDDYRLSDLLPDAFNRGQLD